MMFDDVEIADYSTGTSMKKTATSGSEKIQEFSEESKRVTTTDSNDIFDDEIWNNQVCTPQKKIISYQDDQAEIREKPEEEYFRLVSPISFYSLLNSFIDLSSAKNGAF